jgi:tripeptidyl-peptidase-1
VVAVGATQGPEAGKSEFACSSQTGCGITTGGGFSVLFDMPSYQTNVVQSYLTNSGVQIPPASAFNANGRAYPDVSALGINFEIVDGGQSLVESGTSASAPVFAAMLTLINAQRLHAGKSSLGFVNPALYQVYAASSDAFHDITQGQNNCCAGAPGQAVCCSSGFFAAPGYDPLGGLGSPNFPDLRDALLNM